MDISRKQFLLLASAMVAGVSSVDAAGSADTNKIVDAGPVEKYAVDGVYTGFRSRGFFVIRHGAKLFALSAICTHRRCKITPEKDHSFTCDCHGSTFTADGHVTLGPATKDLPILPSLTSESGRLMVTVSRS